MPAGLLENDGLMYTGATPWHKMGTKLDSPATAAEAIAAAGLDWQVIQQEVYTRDTAGRFVTIEDKRAVVRADTGEVFAIMSKGYTPAQNNNSCGLLDDLVAQGQAVYHTAGSLFNGRKVFLLIKLPDDIVINKDDVIQPYILLSNSHDGTSALRIQLTPVRVVCFNTLRFATKEKGGFYGKHTKNLMQRAGEAREILGLATAYYEMFAKKADEMLNTRLTVMEVQDYLQKVYEFKPDKTYADQDHRRISAYETTLDLLAHPTNTLGGMQGTAWAAWNAVTYYVDHERVVRGTTDQRDDKRLDASWFGAGADIRQRAYDLLVPAG